MPKWISIQNGSAEFNTLIKIMDNTEFIRSIPQVPPEIADAVSKGKLVLFIGAGVSQLVNGPSWQDLATNTLEHLYKCKVVNFVEKGFIRNLKDSRKILSICFNLYKDKFQSTDKLYDIFSELLKPKEEANIYDDLYSMNAIYITTNYDTNLVNAAERYFNIQNRDIVNPTTVTNSGTPLPPSRSKEIPYYIHRKDLLPDKLDKGSILYLHGSIDTPKDMVVTIFDYLKLYDKDSIIRPLLEKVFKDHTVLFIGYGLDELEILEFLIRKYHMRQNPRNHFMLFPIFSHEINLISFEEKYYLDLGIHLIPYFLDIEGYGRLNKIIQAWAPQISSKASGKDHLTRIEGYDHLL